MMQPHNPIARLRRAKGYSQEYLAEQLGVSRQAVSKWEQGKARPDMEHMIRLAQILDTPLESLTGREQPPLPPAAKEKRPVRWRVLAVCLLAVLVLAAVLRIHTLPVDWDAGACGGGYATYIFDKYSRQLTEKYHAGSPNPEQLLSVQAVRGTQQAEWEGRTLYLHFTIAYEDALQGAGTAQVTFIGHRYWFDSFTWGGAIVAL